MGPPKVKSQKIKKKLHQSLSWFSDPYPGCLFSTFQHDNSLLFPELDCSFKSTEACSSRGVCVCVPRC